MDHHKFKIGASVCFRSLQRIRSAAPGEYRIVGYQPSDVGEARYLIKSEAEKHQRAALESELDPAPKTIAVNKSSSRYDIAGAR